MRHGIPRPSRLVAALPLCAAAAVVVSLVPAAGQASGATPVTVNGSARFQHIDGFGFSEAFQRSNILHGSQGLSPANQENVLSLLFSKKTGAGFSIVRLGIGSSPDSSADHMASIEPVSPGSPDATPQYVWDGNDNSQVWLAQQAQSFGVHRIYADAWSAPGYMKTTGTDFNGGWLCGMPGQACPSGDWRQAYANYLAQFIKFYAQSGVHITDVGFLNEPELVTTYASMLSDGPQAADFIPFLHRALTADHLHTNIVCCDGEGWVTGGQRINDVLADPSAAKFLDVASAHGYTAPPNAPITSQRPVWESEWAVFDPWDPAWDDGSDASGMTWAQNVQTALTSGDISAFLYWWGASASTANSGLIRLVGDSYTASGRFWALAAFSRFIRPGAVRIGATTDTSSGLSTSAFMDRDGRVVVELLNTSTSAVPAAVSLRNVPHGSGFAQPYLTDAGDQVAAQAPVRVFGGHFTTSVPPRSIVTVVLPGRR
jgi:glucuronoarabinoxylan endo-1,4-beta-xylanase